MNLPNFDYLKHLYETDPEQFKITTDQFFEAWILEQPKERQRKLQQKHWLIQRELSKYKDPIARMNRMVELFWTGVTVFRETLENPINQHEPSKTPKPNNVISFYKARC